MRTFLQVSRNLGSSADNRLPTFSELVEYYGPYLGLVIALIIVILILQFVWFKRIVKAKDAEIKRLGEREQELNDRVLYMISEEIGYKKRTK